MPCETSSPRTGSGGRPNHRPGSRTLGGRRPYPRIAGRLRRQQVNQQGKTRDENRDLHAYCYLNLKQTLQRPIEDVSAWWLKAQAQAELLGALCLTGQLDPARSLLTDTLATARSLGPAQTDIANKIKSIKSAGTNRLVQQVKAMLELTGDDLAQQAAGRLPDLPRHRARL